MTFKYQSWYEQNSERLNNARRNRYNQDPEYKKKVLKRNKESRKKRKKELSEEKRAEKKAIRAYVGGQSWKEIKGQVEIDGQTVEQTFLTVGALAKAIGKSLKTVRIYEEKGLIPPTPYRSAKNDRLYTPEMVEEIVKKLTALGKVGPPRKSRLRYIEKEVQFADGRKQKMVLFRVGTFAKAVDRNTSTIEQMEQKGYLPMTPLRGSRLGYRLYSFDMIESAKRAFDSLNRSTGHPDWETFRSKVEEAWKSLGMLDAKVIE